MKALIAAAALALIGAALAGCNAGNPNPPSLDLALSSPPNLEQTLDAGTTATGYVYYDNAGTEYIAGNTDSLSNVSIDSTGLTGLLTLAPLVNQMPGIYYLVIDAANSNGTVTNTMAVNVLPPGQPYIPTIVNVPMNGATNIRTTVTLFSARNEMSVATNMELLTADGTSPSSVGVNVNGINATINTGTNSFAVSADITMDRANLPPLTQPVIGADGSAYSKGILLQFNAYPLTNDVTTYGPYVEWVFLNPVD